MILCDALNRTSCMAEFLIWSVSVILIGVGLVGVVLPLIPGTLIILVAALVHHWLRPQELSWTGVGVIAALWALSVLVEFGSMALGTRWFGGSKWGMAGASGGALVGMFFSLPLIVGGTVLGAVLAEKFLAKQTNTTALKAGMGAAAGFAFSLVARLVCAFAMVAAFLIFALRNV
ncbi:MAG TPA: DUF456 domain-containing protein [Opitutaceae bacterium]